MIRSTYRSLFFAAAMLISLALAAASPARAAVFIPTKLTDSADGACDADCSLREAVLAANAAVGPDFIVLGAGTYTLSLAGAGEELAAIGDLDVTDDLAIVGRDAAGTVIDAFGIDRGFDVPAGVKLELVSLTVTNGFVLGGPGGGIRVAGELELTRAVVRDSSVDAANGGGIAGVGESSVLTIDQSTILHNGSEQQGGGLYVEGTIHLINSTLSTNTAGLGGGGLYATPDAVGTVSNSTITLNSAGSAKGGGVYVDNVPFISVEHPVFENTIIAGNLSSAVEKDCFGLANSAGHNLLGIGSDCPDFGGHPGDLEGTAAAPLDAKLLPLAATGGPTPVHRPNTGSPAIDHGAGCEPVDQRGAARSETACEIGSVEVTGQCITGGPALCLNRSRFQVQVTWTTATGIGAGQASQLTDESGFFTFFDPSNVELTVKVLNGCNLGGHYWVFLSGLTNVGVQVTVTDTQTGATKTYNNPLNKTFAPVLDTNAFATCP
ncbi:MAG: choice-of-anchor Q domain-containing protein [Thermoanaerobaculia bacterium]